MTAVLTPLIGLPAQDMALDADRISRDAASAFGAIFDSALPAEPTQAHPPVPEAIEAELTPRNKLGISWPTQPSRSSPPERGDTTTSSAPASPEDGPSGQPLKADNVPMLKEFGETPNFLGPRLDGPSPDGPGPQFIELPELDAAFRTPLATNAPNDFAFESPTLRRREAATLPRGLDGLLFDAPSAAEVPEPEPTMWSDPFPNDGTPDGAELDSLEAWEDVLLSRTEERALRVEFDMDLAVEVKAVQGEVDVHVDGTRDAVEALGDLEVDLEQALADGGEHFLGRYTSHHRDPTARPQASTNRADPQDTPAVQQRRYAPGGRLFNGTA